MAKRIIISEAMLKSLLSEALITEISAEQAYDRYYSSIPREDFDTIVALSDKPGNPDKWIQFFLSAVRDGDCDVDTACKIITDVKNADGLVRQNIKNKFAQGEYNYPEDIADDLAYFSNGGSVLSRKSFAKEGIEKIAENERWIVTCTTNWVANNHYFGKEGACWCTASDMFGRFNGYHMFRNYSYECNAVLIQFKWKGKIEKWDGDPNHKHTDFGSYSYEDFDPQKGYVGEVINECDSLIQMSKYVDNIPENIKDVENKLNASCGGLDGLIKFVGKELFNAVTENSLLVDLLDKVREMEPIEAAYAKSIFERVKRKKQKEREKFEVECKRMNDEILNEIKEKWTNFIETEMYKEPSVIEHLRYRRTISGEFGYAYMGRKFYTVNGVEVGKICAYREKFYRVEENEGGNGYKIVEHRCQTPVYGTILLIYTEQNEYVNSVYLETIEAEGASEGIFREVESSDNDLKYRFFTLEMYDYVLNRRTFFYLIDSESGKIEDISGCENNRIYSASRIGNEIFFFGNGYDRCFSMNEKTKEINLRPLETRKILFGNNGDIAIVQTEEGYSIKIPNVGLEPMGKMPKEIEEIWGGYYRHGAFLVHLYFKDDTVNIYDCRDKELVFGIFGEDILDYDEPSMGYEKKGKKWAIIRYVKNGGDYYYKTWVVGDLYATKLCDKYGNTAEDHFKKNMQIHQNAGEYDHGEDWGRAAMRDWGDEDHPNPLTDDDINRRGYFRDDNGDILGWRDDNEVRKAFTDWINEVPSQEERDKQWPSFYRNLKDKYTYRMDRYGRPITQPWNTEDEVPAKLSDRVVREGFEKMKSIWNRLGLND